MGNNARGQWEVAGDAEDPAYVSGNWYHMLRSGPVGAGAVMGVSVIRLHPFQLRQFVTIQQLGARITTLAAGGSVQLGIYAANANTFAPTQPLARTGSLATDTAGNIAGPPVAGNVQLSRGIYWFGINVDATAGGVVVTQILTGTSTEFGNLIGDASQNNISSTATVATFIRQYAFPFGTWPDLTGVVPGNNNPNNAYAAGQFQVAA